MNDISRNLRRASSAVAGFGLGGLIFAAVFARPQLWETPFFLTGRLPIAGVMFYGGIAACRSAPRAGADDTRPPAPPVARFLRLQLMGVVGVGLTGAAILLVAIGGSLALLALIVAAALYLVIFS
ncbi:hypothetical protein WDL40_10570 [Xanthomonas arboricola pv. pruni]|uniref:Uncharacterized protein n=1 Tax=Xanthomonas campestris pv. juglandis TaxID=195709 RepID=A0A8E4EQR2_XANCJ|nr:hypothetical protein [Xanthomonas arboricola]AKU48539.1 hypothetical protein AKJ12_01105 [Xanthomonas arboricola pv. juglandis]KOA98514.1 hypothetical protein AE920_14455 [Xanthomonas arboricola]KOB16764.1 hypothetical protein AE924_06310 [Xanthomonas arboricola]KOB21104.1 hypothetical protein AE926_20385 [Xanthomonas arboricola]KOB30560.1 hypothetical protein AE928_14795 [Xanthomonas arboricola]